MRQSQSFNMWREYFNFPLLVCYCDSCTGADVCLAKNGRIIYEGAAAELAQDEDCVRALAGASAESWDAA